MNLERLLAENMIRFGTKNVNGAIRRTLLNEGVTAGSSPEDPFTYDYSPTIADITKVNNTIGTWLQPYSNIKMNPSMLYAAVGALTMATVAKVSADKKLMKALESYSTPAGIYSLLVGNFSIPAQSAANTVIQQTMPEATKQVTYNLTKVDVYPYPKDPRAVATVGQAQENSVTSQEKQMGSTYTKLASYMNKFNMGNVLQNTPDYTQYNLSTMVDQNNFVNLLTTATETNKLIVYTTGDKVPAKADKELTSTTVGASAPVSKQYDVSFDSGVATIPANDAEVATAVQDAIAMFPDGNISNLTVVSSASPEYNSAQGGPKALADYGQNTTGTGDPGAGTDNIAKNKKLAYDRGVSFMTALNAGLAAQGKPEITGYTINWQISDKGGSKVPGRYAEVQWEKAGSKGTEVPGAKSTGVEGANVNLKDTYNYNMHTFSW
jgi:hypothetical protein